MSGVFYYEIMVEKLANVQRHAWSLRAPRNAAQRSREIKDHISVKIFRPSKDLFSVEVSGNRFVQPLTEEA